MSRPRAASAEEDVGGILYGEADEEDQDERRRSRACARPGRYRRLGGKRRHRHRPQGRGRHPGLRQAPAERARRLPHDQRGRRRALCRQGAQPQEARRQLCPGPRALEPHRADDPRDGEHGVRHHAHRDRSAAAGGEPHQAPAAAFQRAAARRQVVSLHPDHRRPPRTGDLQAPRGAFAEGRLFRALRLGRRSRADDQRAAAGLPDPHLLRQRVREPDAAVPALPDQALLGAVHGRDLPRRTMPNWSARRRTSFPARARR